MFYPKTTTESKPPQPLIGKRKIERLDYERAKLLKKKENEDIDQLAEDIILFKLGDKSL